MPEDAKDSVEDTTSEGSSFDSTTKDRSEGRDVSRDISENISNAEEPKDFSSDLDLSFIEKEVSNFNKILEKPSFEDFKNVVNEMPVDEELKKRKEALKFDEMMKKNLEDPEYRKNVKEQQELEKNTPGTKEYKRREMDEKASEAAVSSNAQSTDIVREASKEYLQSAGTQLVSGFLGPQIGAAMSRIPGVNTVLALAAEKLGPAGGPAAGDLLMNIFGNNAANVGGGVATSIMSTTGKGVEGKAGWGVQIDPDMYKNAIDNIGLGDTKLGQWMKDKLSGIEDSPITDEEVQNELDTNPELADQLATAIVDAIPKDVKDRMNEEAETLTESKEEKASEEVESKEASEEEDTAGTEEVVKSIIDATDTEDIVKEVESKDDRLPRDYVRETVNNAIDRLKDADNFRQFWNEASSLVKRVKQAISDGDDEEAMKWFWRVANILVPGYDKMVAGATIVSVLLERLFNIRLVGGSNVHGEREGEDVYNASTSPGDLSTRRDSSFIGGQNQSNSWNKGIQQDVYSDEQIKGFVRTMVRGQPHVRNLANKFRK